MLNPISFLKVKKGFTLGLIILLIQLFLYVNADWVYGDYADSIKQDFLVYFIMTTVIMSYYAKPSPLVSEKPENLKNFVLVFLILSLFLVFIPQVIWGGITDLKLFIGVGLFHAFIVAFNEELIFRQILPNILGNNLISKIASNGIFAVFHIGILHAEIWAVGFIFILGMIFSFLKDIWGVSGSTGGHFAYNCHALGILKKMLGVE